MYILLFVSLYFEVFMLVSFIEYLLITDDSVSLTPLTTPTVAIIVPCFNEEKTVASTLKSLLALDYPADKLELLVIDDGSHDNTLAVARSFEKYPQINVFSKSNGGKHTAMNFALTHTNADFIGCLDADSSVEPGALRVAIEVFADPRVAAVTPGIHVRSPKTWLQHVQFVEYRLSLFNRFMLASLGSAFITPGPFSILRARVVRELGGWRHAHSTEDMEMAIRIQEAGHLIANAPGAIVHTSTPRTVSALFKQRVRWTYGFLQNMRDNKHLFGNALYGNLGLIVLPTALISIGAAMYFFLHMAWSIAVSIVHVYEQLALGNVLIWPRFDVYFINTSMLGFIIMVSILLLVTLLAAGSWIGTRSKFPPLATPLFVLCYGFLAPLWLGTAVYRAARNNGVQWR